MKAPLVYSTERYKRLVDAGGDYVSIFRSFLFDAEVFRRVRAKLQAESLELSSVELDQKFQLYFSNVDTPDEEKQESIQVVKERAALYHSLFTNPQLVGISNARNLSRASDLTGLNLVGFTIVPHCSSVPLANMGHMSQTESQEYYRELIEVAMKELSPQSIHHCHGFCASHLIRHENNSGNADDPIMFVHNDFTDTYKQAVLSSFAGSNADVQYQTDSAVGFHPAQDVLRQMKSAGITERQLKESRIVVLNAWRSIGGGSSCAGLRRKPLAVCDIRSVRAADLFAEKMGPSGDELRTCGALFNAEHRWYFFPEMTADELLLFKTYDSDMQPFIPTLHSAFDDPSCPMDAPPRVSCEARVLIIMPSTGANSMTARL